MPKQMPPVLPQLNQSYGLYALLAFVVFAFGLPDLNFLDYPENSPSVCLDAEATQKQNFPNLSFLPEIEESEDEIQHGYRKKNLVAYNPASVNPTHTSDFHALDENRNNLQRQAIPLFIWNHSWKTDPCRFL